MSTDTADAILDELLQAAGAVRAALLFEQRTPLGPADGTA
jgi:hypothetical protein